MQLKQETRLVFLRMFTEELIKNIKPRALPQILTQELGKEIPQIQIPPEIQQPASLEALPPIPQAIQTLPPIRRPHQPFPRQPLQVQPPQLITPQTLQPPVQPIHPDLTAPTPHEFTLGKLEKFLKDPSIGMIECPGPGKLVLVKTFSNTKTTKISLSEDEIKEVVNKFSEQAKIPVMTGVFKAAVGNLLITAILSEFVGSRFIITRRIG